MKTNGGNYMKNTILKIFNEHTKEYEINPNYDPRRVLLNKNYNPYKKKWNKWVGDGSSTLADKILNSQLYNDIKSIKFNTY